MPFVTVTLNGRSIFEETNFFKEFIYALIYSTPPGPVTRDQQTSWDIIPFADDEMWHNNDSAKSAYWGDAMQILADLWPNYSTGQHAREWLAEVKPDISNFIKSVAGSGEKLPFNTLPLDYFAPGPGFFYIRNHWGKDATLIALQLGYAISPPSHQHWDCGTFQIWRDGAWLSRESVGYEDDLPGFGGHGTVQNEYMPAHNGLMFHGYSPDRKSVV